MPVMQTQAAVAWKAGQPLTIETVDLEGPRPGEVLVELRATGICHTDWYTLSGADPEGLFPAILGHEGANVAVFGLGGIGLNVIQGAKLAGADYSFECIGNTQIATRPFQLVTGRVWKGSAFGGARGRTDVPKIVDWYMDRRIRIDELITHRLRLDQINEGFELMKRGESIRSVVVY